MTKWAEIIGFSQAETIAFTRIAADLQIEPEELLRRLAARVVATAQTASNHGLEVLPWDIKETGFMWPADKPFPWSAAHCKAAVLGYAVYWPGEFDDFLHLLRGKWEMLDGYAVLHQS